MEDKNIYEEHFNRKTKLRTHRKKHVEGKNNRYDDNVEEIEKKIEETTNNPMTSTAEDDNSRQEEKNTAHKKRILLEWHSPEFDYFKKSKTWYIVLAVIFSGLIVYGIISKSFITIITFVILFIIIYMYAQKKPEEVYFAITLDGIINGEMFYPFENIQSFWIDYDPPHITALHINLTRILSSKITIQLIDQDPVELRRFLIRELPEDEKLADGVTEHLSRKLRF